jgi:hypothetical protein
MRWALVVVCLVAACKKKEVQEEPAPAPTGSAGSVGHSKTKVDDEQPVHTDENGRVIEAKTAEADDGGVEADASLYGGNGQAAYRDKDGHLHGPGGPIFMGKGVECTDKVDHCLRPGVYFSVPNLEPGKLYRATPVFEFEGKWWNFREEEISDSFALFKTKTVERGSELHPGSPVIWLLDANSSDKWLDNEFDALTSSRWDAGIIESVGPTSFKVKGYGYGIDFDMARVVTERRK